MSGVGERTQARLSAMGRQRGFPTELLIIRHVMEGFLARLAASNHSGQFALKGGLLFAVWQGDMLRATTDVDLHGMRNADSGRMLEVVREICAHTILADDGARFDVGRARWTRLVGGRVAGDRVVVPATVGSTAVMLKVDVGFGHAVTPGFEHRWYPGLLPGSEPIRMPCYPMETVIAEKLATAVEFGRDNTRVRDYWDLHALSRARRYSAHSLDEAIRATFATRDAGAFLGREGEYWKGALRPEYATIGRSRQWTNWLRSHAPSSTMTFGDTLASVTSFALPLLHAIRDDERLPGNWDPDIGWSRGAKGKRDPNGAVGKSVTAP